MRIYNRWTGNPKGHPEDTTRCVVSVSEPRVVFYQCLRKRGYGKDGLLCKQHAEMEAAGKSLWIPKDKDEVQK